METVSFNTIHVAVADASMVSETRRKIAALADALGFTETQGGRAAIVATELATNLLKHAGGGDVYASASHSAGVVGIDIVAVDVGRGMSDIDTCLRDGYSTAGSAGTGLGAISRLSSRLDVHSVAGIGTIVHARVSAVEESRTAAADADVFGISLPYPGEQAVGDAWVVHVDARIVTLAVIDGLGHGPLAAEASNAAIVVVKAMKSSSPTPILQEIHRALRGLRGAVGGVVRIDFERSTATYAGIGNIAAMIVGASGTKRLVSHNGTLGSTVRRFQSFDYEFATGSIFVASSDGLSSHIDVAKYPELSGKGAAVIASVLMRDYRRGRDDATVVVVRRAPAA